MLSRQTKQPIFNRISGVEALKSLWNQPLAVLFKHSALCGLSDTAYSEMTAFAQENPDQPISLVIVQEDRELSSFISTKTEIEHESPQLIVLRHGVPVAVASHRKVTCKWLQNAVEVVAQETKPADL